MNHISMKKSVIFLSAIIFAVLTGCVKKTFDEPPLTIPTVDFQANATIAGLKAMYTTGVFEITADTIIQGIVSATDESGNIYKTLYIQDNTGGLNVQLDLSGYYTEYRLGQKLLIKCKGLYLGSYGGVIELGYGVYSTTAPSRIPASMISSFIYKDSLPGKQVEPVVLDFVSSLNDKLSMLVKIENVRFPEAGQPICIPGSSEYTERIVGDVLGNPIIINDENFIIRTSSYANFGSEPLPLGIGTLQGILSVYNGTYQLAVRDMNDFVDFDTTGIGPILMTIYEQNFDVNPPDWVTFSVKSNKNWGWSSQFTCMAVNGYGGDAASEDWLVSPGIDLTGVSDAVLTFKMWTKYTDGGLQNPMEVFVSTNYSGSGDPTGATWTPLACTLPAANSASWTSSGDVDLSMYHQKVYIGYRYKSSGTGSNSSSSWEMDTFKVEGEK